MTRILVVDDEPSVGYTLEALFVEQGYEVQQARSAEQALGRIGQELPDVVITDLAMPGMGGMALLERLRREHPQLPVVVITAHGSERTAVQAMKLGAWDYLSKPFDIDEVAMTVASAVERLQLRRQNDALRAQRALSRPIIYRSDAMERLMALTFRAARRDITVLITGETGTGKELVARAIHELSQRAAGPFVRFNAGALTASLAESELFGHEKGAFTGASRRHVGLFERAHGGTLLLDEIGEMSPDLQANLLRVLQEGEIRPVGASTTRKIDVRVVAATHRDLAEMVRAGSFREDLYYRLNVVHLHVPPLRERREDIAPLAAHFLAQQAERFKLPELTLAPEVMDHLLAQPWPGNIRQVENAVSRLAALSDGERITGEDLLLIDEAAGDAPVGDEASGLRARVGAFERALIDEVLQRHEGNQSAAARELQISRVTLIDKLKRYGLHPRRGRGEADEPG